jgi:hypothetical protein
MQWHDLISPYEGENIIHSSVNNRRETSIKQRLLIEVNLLIILKGEKLKLQLIWSISESPLSTLSSTFHKNKFGLTVCFIVFYCFLSCTWNILFFNFILYYIILFYFFIKFDPHSFNCYFFWVFFYLFLDWFYFSILSLVILSHWILLLDLIIILFITIYFIF